MANRSARGQITFIDVTDGVDPISAFLTNENHTFTASEAGVVADRVGFSSTLRVFVGQTAATYSSSLSAANQFTITSVAYVGTSTGWGTPANTNGVITIPSITNSAVADVIIRVTFSVRNSLSNDTTGLTRDVSLSIVKQGAGGQAVSMSATNQTFFATSDGTIVDNATTNPDITITLDTAGSTGNLTYSISQNGGSFNARTSTGSGAGQIAGYDTDATGSFLTGTIPPAQGGVARLRITRANMGTNRSMSIQIAGANGGLDVITLFRVEEGAAGDGALLVDVTTTSPQGTVFKNAAGTAKTTIANVVDSATGGTPTGTITYDWTYANGTQVRVASASDFNVVTSGGLAADGSSVNTNRIIVGAEDVTDAASFICDVDVSTS